MDRAADNHYPTMTGDNLAALELPAADDCVLFLWATVPMERGGAPDHGGMGIHLQKSVHLGEGPRRHGLSNRNQHEILLIGTRGHRVQAPAPGEQFPVYRRGAGHDA